MSAYEKPTDFEKLLQEANKGHVSVSDAFSAFREKRVNEDEFKILLDKIQVTATPMWRRVISA